MSRLPTGEESHIKPYHFSIILAFGIFLNSCKTGATLTAPPTNENEPGLIKTEPREPLFSSFNDFISQVYATADPVAKQALVDSFITWAQSTTGIPYVEDSTRAYFLYRSVSAASVQVAGDFNNWDPGNQDLIHLSGTNLFYRAETFETDARLDYKFVLNNSQWILDPLNSHTCSGGYGPNSELSMPAYNQPPEIQFYPIPHGTMVQQTFTDSAGLTRTVRIYLPPDYATSGVAYPAAYFHDGGEYVTLASAANILDYLIENNRIQPVIGVFIDPRNRNDEYSYDYNFIHVICDQLVPWIDDQYRTIPTPENRATIGVSLGGLVSFLFAVQRPDVFGNCGAFSPALWLGDIIPQYQAADTIAAKIYLDAGTYESSIYDAVQSMRTVLDNRSIAYTYQAWHEGHSWGAWRAHLDESLETFWPAGDTGIVDEDSP